MLVTAATEGIWSMRGDIGLQSGIPTIPNRMGARSRTGYYMILEFGP